MSSIAQAARHAVVVGDLHLLLPPDRAIVNAGIIITIIIIIDEEDQYSISINSVRSTLPWVGPMNCETGANVKAHRKQYPENVNQIGREMEKFSSLATVPETSNQYWWTYGKCATKCATWSSSSRMF